MDELSQLMWAGQGITDLEKGYRTAPSGPPPGAAPPASAPPGAPRPACAPGSSPPPGAGTRPSPVDTAAVMIIITGDNQKTNESGYFLESGHVAQNIALQCVPLDMGLVTTRGFNESALKTILKLSDSEIPIYVLPAGQK